MADQKYLLKEGMNEPSSFLSVALLCTRSWSNDSQKGIKKWKNLGFPGGAVVESLPADAGDTGSGPGLGGSRVRHRAAGPVSHNC